MFLTEILNAQSVSDFLHVIFVHAHGTNEKESIWLKIKQQIFDSTINPCNLMEL